MHARHFARLSPVVLAALAGAASIAEINPHGGMLRYPDISATHIVFVYANDLWTVPREGGRATPLASPDGQEMFPKFSPDGSQIAFMGNYEGDTDLYVISRDGGLATRVSHHPGTETLNDWTRQNDLLFYMSGLGGLTRQTQLFTIEHDGGEYKQLPVPYGAQGAISPDGKWLAYTPHTRDFRTWKRYRGGMATDIWLFNLETFESKQMTDWEGTDTLPMWAGDTVYYLSDAGPEHRLNLWSYNTRNSQRRQLTNFTDYDVKWPSMGPGSNGRGEIVFQQGSKLYRFDCSNNRTTAVDVFIPGDRPTLRAQTRDVNGAITDWSLSPSAKRVAAVARGDVWTLPAETGTPRNLTRSGGVHERTVSWSPDGQWIAYFSDETGEMELFVTQSDGLGEKRQLTKDSKTFYFGINWSPDSSTIAFTDKAGNLRTIDVESGEVDLIDTDGWGNAPLPSWSSDSRWMSYAKRDTSGSENSSIYIHDTKTGETHRVTSGFYNDSAPAFDRDGEFLYYASNREFSPVYDDMFSGLESPFVYVETEAIIALPLRDDVKSPYLPKSDEEEWKKDDKKDDKKDANGESKPAAKPGDIAGDWSGTSSGMMQMGMDRDTVDFSMSITKNADGSYSATTTTDGESIGLDAVSYNADTGEFSARVPSPVGAVILKATVSGATMTGTWEIEGMGLTGTWTANKQGAGAAGDASKEGDKADDKKKAKPIEIDIEGLESRGIQLPVRRGSFSNLRVNDKGHLLYVRSTGRGIPGGPEIKIFDIKDDKREEKTVTTGGGFDMTADGKKILVGRGGSAQIMNASAGASGKPVVTTPMLQSADPREEWESIIRNAWRVMRDFFYDPTIHGVDWEKVLEDHLAMLPDAVTREDVSFIIQEMIGEVNVGHAYYRQGGDMERSSNRNVGLLGADFVLENGAYKIDKILRGAIWDAGDRGPLNHPGLDVKEGDYLLAVNGVPVDTTKDIYASFIGMAGRPVTLTVSEKPELDDSARRVVVEPIGNETNLRYLDWVERNRQYVFEKSGGKVGYIYVINTGAQGQNELVRQFYGQAHLPALIIDERWNGGGQMPSRFIDLLKRPASNYWAVRDGVDWTSPFRAHNGPKCMLINGLAGSGGDAFPFLFRHHNVGPIIGMRTWGGLVGIGGYPPMVDGSSITAPSFAFYNTDGTWGIEGHGVDPDIVVVDDPAKMVDGGDPQLERAIQEMLDAIEREGYQRPARPAYPDRSKMGIPESDW